MDLLNQVKVCNTVVELQRPYVMEPYVKLLVRGRAVSLAHSSNDDSVNVVIEVADANAYFQYRRLS